MGFNESWNVTKHIEALKSAVQILYSKKISFFGHRNLPFWGLLYRANIRDEKCNNLVNIGPTVKIKKAYSMV